MISSEVVYGLMAAATVLDGWLAGGNVERALIQRKRLLRRKDYEALEKSNETPP